MNNNYIGENIKIYRERQKLTQQQLADKIGKTWEMISRYERGISSPLNQLDSLATALNTTPSDLLKDITDDSLHSNFNKVPFFTKIPENFIFSKKNTYVYYNAPDWIKAIDSEAFAIDLKEVDGANGIAYIAPMSEINLGDLVLIRQLNSLSIVNLESFKDTSIIGKVLAKEIRY